MMCGGLSSGAVEMPFKAGASVNDAATRSDTASGGTIADGAARCATQVSPTNTGGAAFFDCSEAALSSFWAIAATTPLRLSSARAWSAALR